MRRVDSKDLAIGVLATSAVVLFSALMVIQAMPSPVMADATTTSAGGYIVAVTDADPDEEVLYVYDVPAEKIIGYRFNPLRNEIEIIQGIEFGDIRSKAASMPPAGQRRRP